MQEKRRNENTPDKEMANNVCNDRFSISTHDRVVNDPVGSSHTKQPGEENLDVEGEEK